MIALTDGPQADDRAAWQNVYFHAKKSPDFLLYPTGPFGRFTYYEAAGRVFGPPRARSKIKGLAGERLPLFRCSPVLVQDRYEICG